jgi:hypothetical protein
MSSSEDCIDALLWIGKSYRQFLCDPRTTCPKEKPQCFVHEAEWRGVSRKLPQIPKWAVPGRTRIFLCHRGDRARGAGRIFGYFVLGRVEVLLADPENGTTADLSNVRDKKRAPDEGSAKIRTQRCWNGDLITTHRFEQGRWKPTGDECRNIPNNECLDGEFKVSRCPDGSQIIVAVCIDGRWQRTVARCPTLVSITCERFKDPRYCPPTGIRSQPGAIYVVDDLDAAITDEFCRRLHEADIPERYKKARAQGSSREQKDVLQEGYKLFRQVAADKVEAAKGSVAIPDELTGAAYIRGPLVLFRRPPIYDAFPRASFRGYKRIDGESLLQQIASGVRDASVCACQKPGRNAMTKAELAARLACRLRLSQALNGT